VSLRIGETIELWIRGLMKTLGQTAAVDHVNLNIADGTTVGKHVQTSLDNYLYLVMEHLQDVINARSSERKTDKDFVADFAG
jgi:hypothetical protein